MNDVTTRLIDAAFEMSAATKKPYPVEGTPEFFALTEIAHRLECACMAYKKSPPLPGGTLVDGKDGERYRLLRENWDAWTGTTWSGTTKEIASKLDAAIDAAMSAHADAGRDEN